MRTSRAALEQAVDGVRADEAGPARDEHELAHASSAEGTGARELPGGRVLEPRAVAGERVRRPGVPAQRKAAGELAGEPERGAQRDPSGRRERPARASRASVTRASAASERRPVEPGSASMRSNSVDRAAGRTGRGCPLPRASAAISSSR